MATYTNSQAMISNAATSTTLGNSTTWGTGVTISPTYPNTVVWNGPVETPKPKHWKKASTLQKAFREIARTATLHQVHNCNIMEIDTAAAIALLIERNPVYAGRPRLEFMDMFQAISGMSRRSMAYPFFYKRPPIIGHSRSKMYLTHAGYKVLDGIAATNEVFARFLAAYDNKAMRKRATIECTQLLMGVKPAEFDRITEENYKRREKLDLLEREKALLEIAKQQVNHMHQSSYFHVTTSNPWTSATTLAPSFMGQIVSVNYSYADNHYVCTTSNGTQIVVDPVTQKASIVK